MIRKAVNRAGYAIVRAPADIDPAILRTVDAVRPYTRTTQPRVIALCEAVRYLIAAGIEGDIVECGVWRGGSMLAAARTLVEAGDTSRTLWLYDTFEGMSEPTDVDRRAVDGATASELLASPVHHNQVLALASLHDVEKTMALSGYPATSLRYVVGKVEETLPNTVPDSIALLRLDTDWYESTRDELAYLVPRMAPGAVLIIDDYGHWEGSRRAVDEYVQRERPRLMLHRIDYAARIGVIATGMPATSPVPVAASANS
ncbi:MAG: class I SAM-dependent methyltransferase [Candidatus Dormibacteraeota bacterium]|nr:class I SAM-dependent methyltransferase [Candidatus Dormibacteraeota bacterium]